MTNTSQAISSTDAVPPFELKHRLRLAREFAGFDQEHMHQLTGLSRATISAAETGRQRPHPATLRLWAMTTGVSHEWLANGCQQPAERLLATV